MATIFEPPPPYTQQPSLQQQILDLKQSLLSLAAVVAENASGYAHFYSNNIGTRIFWASAAGSLIDSGDLTNNPGTGVITVTPGIYRFQVTLEDIEWAAATGSITWRLTNSAGAQIVDIAGQAIDTMLALPVTAAPNDASANAGDWIVNTAVVGTAFRVSTPAISSSLTNEESRMTVTRLAAA